MVFVAEIECELLEMHEIINLLKRKFNHRLANLIILLPGSSQYRIIIIIIPNSSLCKYGQGQAGKGSPVVSRGVSLGVSVHRMETFNLLLNRAVSYKM